MREIKFRGKTVTTDSWVYGHYAFVDGFHVIYEGTSNPVIIKLNTLGEYTGLKDVNGIEIFEGDTVKVRHTYDYLTTEGYERNWTTTVGEVAYNQGTFDIKRIDKNGGEVWQGITMMEYLSDMLSEWEVIGNIYENPELLEVKEDE